MRFKRRKASKWTSLVIDLTPLIDVVFILLIFFLLTAAPSPDPTMSVHLPRASAGKINNINNKLVLVMKDNGDLYIEDNKINIKELEGILKEQQKMSPASKVVLQGDRKAQYDRFIEILEAVNKANLSLAVAVEKE
ncbi:MAG: ExbD/TolR family protein [Myxococcota bacterium]